MSIREKLRNIKQQLMYSYDQGAQIGKDLKKSHREKVEKIIKKK